MRGPAFPPARQLTADPLSFEEIQAKKCYQNSVQAMVRQTKKRFGTVDMLVNNAGGTYHPRPFLNTPRSEWEWEINLNIWGVINCYPHQRAAHQRQRRRLHAVRAR